MKIAYLIKLRRRLQFSFLTVLAFIASLCLAWTPKISVLAQSPITQSITQRRLDPHQQEQKGQELYLSGQFELALVTWQQAAQGYHAQGNMLSQARVLSNLCLAYQKLGQWPEAEGAIARSLKLLENQVNQNGYFNVLAQALNNQGSIQLAAGKAQPALETWQQATEIYTQAQDMEGVLRSQINQAQAMQTLGFYRRALQQLEQVNHQLQPLPNSHLKVVGLRNWGNLLKLVGDVEKSRQILEQTLAVARTLSSPQEIGATLFSLGNTAVAQQETDAALAFYEQGLALPVSLSTKTQLQLAKLSLFLGQKNWQSAQKLLPVIDKNLNKLPLSHRHISARINFARSLIKFNKAQLTKSVTNTKTFTWESIAQLLATAVKQAEELGDQRIWTYAVGTLGEVYEQTQQWSTAQELTEQALFKAQVINAPEIAYRWQWQLGRLHQAQDHQSKAISAYSESVQTLKSLRSDLAATNSEVQFSFAESVEPVYRQLVSLLLQGDEEQIVTQDYLSQARDVIESLQLAELDNFLQEACLDTETVQIDRLDNQAAVIYPIILDHRLEIIVSLPEQPLHHYHTDISRSELEAKIGELRAGLVIRSRRDYVAPSRQLYNWLIHPIIADVEASGVKTLVFVPDGTLRNVPMATLNDGQDYLIEKYNIALTPGLQLLGPQPLQQVELKTLAAGLTQERQGFTPLDNVASELEEIKTKIPSQLLLDQEFTNDSFKQAIESDPFNIIHIATHGQFSSNLEDTFLLTWDDRISINQLDEVLQQSSHNRAKNIELLVLSACETASGDQRAALGLAGMAVRAGARSTLATLWSVNDRATAEFMSRFYQGISVQTNTKAEAIRQGQLELLKNPLYKHPYYWSPYVLVGNWL